MDDLKLIKKHYGEKTMHLCRELFPTLLEEKGLLFSIMSEKFAYYKYLADDIIEEDEVGTFKDIIYSCADKKAQEKNNPCTTKTPQELLDEAGYILYECKTEEDIQKFKKYYANGEELCTFLGNRLDRCHVFFAVKKNVDEIKRQDFIGKEERQDEYGTSVISIQFARGNVNTLSIKNRYNHTVSNPDATFSNNLENIIEGLTEAFEKTYNLNIKQNIMGIKDLKNFVWTEEGKYYRYNYESFGDYFCPDNVIIDNYQEQRYDKSRYLIFDEYILDMKEKSLRRYHKYSTSLDWVGIDKIHQKIDSIRIENNKANKTKTIYINDDTIIVINHRNSIVEYHNNSITTIPSEFFITKSLDLKVIDLPEVVKINSGFQNNSICRLNVLNIPKVEEIGSYFNIFLNSKKPLSLLKLKKVGNSFMSGTKIPAIYLPELEEVGDSFLPNDKGMESITLPKCKRIGGRFMFGAENIEEVNLPIVESISDDFMKAVKTLKRIYMPSVKYIGSNFLRTDTCGIEELDLPEVLEIGHEFLIHNQVLKRIYAPKVKKIKDDFLRSNLDLRELTLESVEEIWYNCLKDNDSLEIINIPNIKKCELDLYEKILEIKDRQKVYE